METWATARRLFPESVGHAYSNSRLSNRQDPGNSHLSGSYMAAHLWPDYLSALQDRLSRNVSEVDADSVLVRRRRRKSPVFWLGPFSRTGAQRGGVVLQDSGALHYAVHFWWHCAHWTGAVEAHTGIQHCCGRTAG